MSNEGVLRGLSLAMTIQNATGRGGGTPVIPVPDVIKQQYFEYGLPNIYMIDESTLCIEWTATNDSAAGVVFQPWVTSVTVSTTWVGNTQYGTCNANGILPDIISRGTNRTSYHNVSTPSTFTVSSGGGTSSIFIGSVHIGTETYPSERSFIVKL